MPAYWSSPGARSSKRLGRMTLRDGWRGCERERNMNELEAAWKWREERGILAELDAVRVFHGPGEGSGAFREMALDRFGEHYWLTEWGSPSAPVREAVSRWVSSRRGRSLVVLARPEKTIAEMPVTLWGQPPREKLTVSENVAR